MNATIAPRIVHIIPRGGRWVVLAVGHDEGGITYPDHGLALEVMRLFKRFQEVGTTVVIATHDLTLLQEFGQREIHIADGQVRDGVAPPPPDTTPLPQIQAQR
jgi:energy-coupling factor transporter ATP-binding protein EcfA2